VRGSLPPFLREASMMTTVDASAPVPSPLPPAMVTARQTVHWSLVPWVPFALMVPMALSADDPSLANGLIIGVWSYGPLALLCSLAAKRLWSRGRQRAAVIAIAPPLAILAVVVLGLVWGALTL
jgi:hypothetical protein